MAASAAQRSALNASSGHVSWPAASICEAAQELVFVCPTQAMDVTKPYEFIGFGAMDVSKPYKFIGFGTMDVTKP